MHDDRLDPDLARRLRAYESQIPGDEAPPPGVRRSRGFAGWWVLAIGGAAVAAAGLFLAATFLNLPSAPAGQSSSSPTPTLVPSPATSPEGFTSPPTASPTGSYPAAASDFRWDLSVLGVPNGSAFAYDVAEVASGLVAVGVQYEQPMPNLGPPPQHEGRVWHSTGGRSWEDVTPPDFFGRVSLQSVFSRPDGTLVALGTISEEDKLGSLTSGAWESVDGSTWRKISTGLPNGVVRVGHGSRGYVAQIDSLVGEATHRTEIWFSVDGREWEHVRTLAGRIVAIGAGDEGFVASGTLGTPPGSLAPFVIASADGRNWVEASGPPTDIVELAPLAGDWVAIGYAFGGAPLADHATTWFSTNGLDWVRRGDLPLRTVPAGGSTCNEYPSGLTAAGGWLVLASTLSGPCTEGGFVVPGIQRISAEGTSWAALPFEVGTPGTSGSGSTVNGSIAVGGRLVLVGEANQKAAFWIGEAP